ncbi:hypothetical protein ACFE04_011480 [Oxalis oulophora]
MRCGIDPASPSSFYILLDDKACLSMFYPAFAPLSTTGMVILPAPAFLSRGKSSFDKDKYPGVFSSDELGADSKTDTIGFESSVLAPRREGYGYRPESTFTGHGLLNQSDNPALASPLPRLKIQ